MLPAWASVIPSPATMAGIMYWNTNPSIESRPHATAQVKKTRRTLGDDCWYQPVSDRSACTAASVTGASYGRSHAAIHADVGAVDETRTWTREEGDEIRQFLHSPDT